MLKYARLKELLSYDVDTGLFTWNIDYRDKKAGQIAGLKNCNGYIFISFDGKQYLAHRLAWLIMTGDWPVHCIDHIDRNRSNNKFDNLRDVEPYINRQNTLLAPGLRIYHNRKAGRCTGYMKTGTKIVKWVYFGSFANEEEVVAEFLQLTSTATTHPTNPF